MYGRVQNVKLLAGGGGEAAGGGGGDNDVGGGGGGAGGGVCAAVAFMDIKSAAKAHGVDHTLDERLLTTVYYEPQAILSRPSSPPAAAATPAYQGSSSGASSGAAAPGTQSAVVDRTARPRDRPYRNGPSTYTTATGDGCSRGGSHQRWYGGYGSSPTASAETVGPEVGVGGRRRARSGSSSGSGSSSRSVSSSSAARSGSSSSSRASSSRGKRRRPSGGRPLAICVRNLPQRSSDSSLKDGLFHEYKKHGKVSCVKVVGANQDRYAVVRFKKASDAEKALEVSQDKLFFGCKISVAPYQGADADDDESRPYETDLDEFHPKATRTLFVGNLDKDATAATLRDKFKHFGKIVEIDVKKQSGGAAGYAFCQYANISSVVDAIRNMDGEHVGGSRVKLGFGKSMATSCIWIDGVTESSEKQVFAHCTRIGAVTQISLCNGSGHALVAFEQVAAAQQAVKELRGLTVRGRKLQVDFASRECQEAFYEQREKQCNSVGATPETRAPAEVRFSELPARSFEPAPAKYNNRYEGSPRSRQASAYGRNRNSRFLSQSSGEHFDATAEFADRRFRYEDFSGGSGSEAAYDPAGGIGAVVPNGPVIQSVVVVSSPVSGPPAPPPPVAPNMRLLQKERVHLLEQLEECPSSGDELISPKKRFKTDRASLGRRSSAETGNRHHRDASPCIKRRRGSEASRHRWHTPSPASRPGTPLHDERPDSPPPTEPRRLIPLPRRSVPMCLPLPRFAAQVLPRVALVSPQHPPSGPPPPASPQRAPSPASSGGSSPSPAEPSLDERIRSLDERYEKWSGSRAALGDGQERTRVRHHLLDLDVAEVQPSEVMRSVLAKRSVFDEDLKRLESIGDKYEAPTRTTATPSTVAAAPSICAFPSPSASRISPSPLNSPQSAGRSPFAGSPSVCTAIKAVVVPPAPALPSTNAAPPAKGLQYPFPSHPPLSTTPALDGVASSLSSSSGSSECSDESVKGLFSERVIVNHIDSVNIPRNISSCVDRVPVSLSFSCEVASAPASVALGAIGRSKTAVVAASRSVPLKCESKTFKVSERKSPAYADPSAPGDDDLDAIEEGDVKTKCGVVNSDNLDRRKNERISVESVKSDSELNVKENRDQSLKQKVSEKPHSDKRTSDKISVNAFNDCDSRMRDSSKVELKKLTISEKVLEISEKRKLHKEEKLSRIFSEKDSKKGDDRKKRDEDKEKFESLDDLSERISSENLENDAAAPERTDRTIDSGKERLDCERRDQEQLEREKNEKDRIEKERKEKEKIERDRLDKDRREKDKLEQVEKERIERELVEKERREKEKLEREKREKEKTEKERREKEKIEKDRAQRERLEREKSDRRESERIDRERCDRERHERVDRPVDPKTDKYEKRKEKEKDLKKKEEREIPEDSVVKEKRKEKEEHSNDGRHRHKDMHKKENHIDKCEKKDFINKIYENNKHKDNGRKTSREESIREIVRKDSSDSAASRNSHDSNKSKDQDNNSEVKDDFRYSSKSNKTDNHKIRHHDKEFSPKSSIKSEPDVRHDKKDKCFDIDSKSHSVDVPTKDKRLSVDDKQRHYSFDSQNEHRNHDLKRKERLNSSCSLPAGVGIKRRVSSQDSFEHEECKKPKLSLEKKAPERRDSRDSGGKQSDKNRHSKSIKNNLSKHSEEKMKEDKKIKIDFEHNSDRNKNKDYKEKDRESNEITNNKENSDKYNDVDHKIDYDSKDFKENCRNKFNDKFKTKRIKETDVDVKLEFSENSRERDLTSDKEFLEQLELRSSLEDEKQSALKREFREKKRLQQLQQIQQLQLHQNVVTQQQHQQDDKKIKVTEERKKEIKEKRISTDRKSREDLTGIKSENIRKKCRKMTNSTDTSDSDEPKKHSIFDIVDDGPTYISMYDKVKARSCKNMQKQEEEKRQEKIKAKFSQLKQSRAKREEKKRSNSWDEDSDSDREHKKSSSKSLIASSSEDEFRRRHKENISSDSENDMEKYKMQKTINDLCDGDSTDDAKNKNISRKNSRSRIMSDTSEDEAAKRALVKIEMYPDADMLDSDSKKRIKPLPMEESHDDKVERINNMFDDKSSLNKNHYYDNNIALKTLIDDKKPIVDPDNPFIKSEHYIKSENMYRYNSQYSDFEYDTYSEEVVISDSAKSKSSFEVRKKHKKKQKRPKVYPSDDEINGEFDKSLNENVDIKNNPIKRKHVNKKDKKRDRIKFEDISLIKDSKKLKRVLEPTVEGRSDTVNNMKSFEIMQDIFGSLSDECDEKVHSDKNIFDSNYGKCKEEVKIGPPLLDLFNIKEKNNHFYSSKVEVDDYDLYSKNSINADMTLKEKYKEELKRKKDKKRKEKKLAIKDDENSLDIDAAGKAIEASLCADNQTDAKKVLDKSDLSSSLNTSVEPDIFRFTDGDDSIESSLITAAHKIINPLNKEIKEKKKKKKRSKEEKLNRKEYHHHHHHREKSVENNEIKHAEIFKPDYIIPCDDDEDDVKIEALPVVECKPPLPSPSLPRLTDSPPLAPKQPESPEGSPSVEIISSPTSTIINKPEVRRLSDKFIPGFGGEIDDTISENAVKSISDFDTPIIEVVEPKSTLICNEIPKAAEKIEEKQRAIISQEETEDAVAALLGESFGSRDAVFDDCYNEPTQNHESSIETVQPEVDNVTTIPDEEAEEMRQAVQSLNVVTELEMKPETPLSENDLQIDTDTDDGGDDAKVEPRKVEEIPEPQPEAEITTIVPRETPANTEENKLPIESETIVEERIIPTVLPKLIAEDLPSTKIIDNKTVPDEIVKIIPPKIIDTLEVNTAPPTVISKGWSLSAHKPNEQPLLISAKPLINARDEKPLHITTSILHLKPINVGGQCRPILATASKVPGTYQVINQAPRPTTIFNTQPPTIKIPEQHVIYQRQPNIVLSPRTASGDIRLNSPKSHIEIQSKVTNMTILTTGPPTLHSPPGLTSSSVVQQRSPSQITVMRMQQPPLSPILTSHLPGNQQNRSMLSPTQHSTVVIQNQNSTVQLNRLPLTPLLAPISKPLIANSLNIPQTKVVVSGGNSTIIQTPKLVSNAEVHKPEIKINPEVMITNPKLIISTAAVCNTQSSTIIMQNRITSVTSNQNLQSSPILMPSHILTKTVITEKLIEATPLLNGPDVKPTVINNNHNFNTMQQIHINTGGPVIQTVPKQSVIDMPNPAKQTSPVPNALSQTQRFVTPAIVGNIVQVDYRKDTTATGYLAPLSKNPVNSTIISIAKPTVLNIIEKPIALQIVPTVSPLLVNTIENDNCSVETITSKIEKDDSGDSAFESSDTSSSDKPKCETDFEELLKQTSIVTKIERPVVAGPNSDVVHVPTETTKVEAVTPDEDIKILITDIIKEPENEDSKEEIDVKEDIDSWSAKDINIDSVIKKVDALCDIKDDDEIVNSSKISWTPDTPVSNEDRHEKNDSPIELNDTNSCDNTEDVLNKISLKVNAKRGGGRSRGRKTQDRITERVQTRQGNKPKAPIVALAKRGRGKGRMDKKCKSPPPTGTNEPGDVYDFHEDSGDDMDNSPQKGEQRPRLILTIKSPLVNNVSHLSSGPLSGLLVLPTKEPVPIKPTLPASPSQPVVKDEKADDFVSPPTNTRKSRRLQEKDVTRNTVDDVIEDVVKNALLNRNAVTGKDTTPVRRSARQNVAKLAVTEKSNTDVRKSPRAVRKTKDRRPSETSVDSSDEKVIKKDNTEVEVDKKLPETKESIVKMDTKESVDSVNTEPNINAVIKPIVKINTEVVEKLIVKPEVIISEDKPNTPIDLPVVQNLKPTPPIEAAVINLNKPVIVSTISAAIASNLTKKMDSNLKTSEELMLDPATGELVYMRPNDEGHFVPVPAGKRIDSTIVTSHGHPVLITRSAAESKIVSQPQPASTGQPVSCITSTVTPITTTPPETVLVSSVVKSLTPIIQINTSRIQTTISQNPEVKIIATNPSVVQTPTTLPPIVAHSTTIIVSSAHNIPSSGTIITKAPVSNVQPSVLTKGHIAPVPTVVSKIQPVNIAGKTIISQQSVQTSNKGPIQLPLGNTPLSKISGPLSPHVQQNVTVKLQIGQQLKPHPMQPQIAHPPQKTVPVLQIGQAPGPGALGPGPLGPSLPRGAQHASPPLLMAKHLAFVGPQPVITGASSSRISLTAVPSISPQAQVPMGDGVYPQFAHQHYQPYYRSHQEVRATPSPYVARSPHGAEGSEAPSPPLELRRPPCARVPHPAHSPSLNDRSTDSPQVTQVYPMSRPSSRVYIDGTSAEPPNGGRYYDSPAPPPAHVPRVHHPPTNHHRILSEAPAMPKMSITQGPGMGVNVGGTVGEERGPSRGCAPTQGGAGQSQIQPGPPHASHAPREADSLMMLLRRYPVMWQGLLALKNDAAAVQMHFVHGNPIVAGKTLPCNSDGSTAPLRIAQRMRLEPVQLEAVARKMQMENEHCMLLALPCGRDHLDVLQQSTHLTSGFITYLRRKQAAGIVNIATPGHHQAQYTVHIFPSCDFANENLERIAPDLLHRVADIAHLLIVIATV